MNNIYPQTVWFLNPKHVCGILMNVFTFMWLYVIDKKVNNWYVLNVY